MVTQLGRRESGLTTLRQVYKDPARSASRPEELEKILSASVRSCDNELIFLGACDDNPDPKSLEPQHLLQAAADVGIDETFQS
jgi:hypothetical protein